MGIGVQDGGKSVKWVTDMEVGALTHWWGNPFRPSFVAALGDALF